MMRRTLAALGVCLLSTGAVSAAYSQTPTLAGTWKLNKDSSDDPVEKMQQAREPAPDAETGMKKGGKPRTSTEAGRTSGAGGSHPSVGGGGGAGAGAPSGGVFSRVMRPAAQITVEQNDTVIIIRDDGLPQLIYLDNRQVEEPGAGGEVMQVTARWKDGKLTVDRKGPNTSLRETFSIDTGKRRLIVDAKLTSAQMQGTISIRRVYDAGT